MKSILELTVVFVSGFLLGVMVMGSGQTRLTRVQREHVWK